MIRILIDEVIEHERVLYSEEMRYTREELIEQRQIFKDIIK